MSACNKIDTIIEDDLITQCQRLSFQIFTKYEKFKKQMKEIGELNGYAIRVGWADFIFSENVQVLDLYNRYNEEFFKALAQFEFFFLLPGVRDVIYKQFYSRVILHTEHEKDDCQWKALQTIMIDKISLLLNNNKITKHILREYILD